MAIQNRLAVFSAATPQNFIKLKKKIITRSITRLKKSVKFTSKFVKAWSKIKKKYIYMIQIQNANFKKETFWKLMTELFHKHFFYSYIILNTFVTFIIYSLYSTGKAPFNFLRHPVYVIVEHILVNFIFARNKIK